MKVMKVNNNTGVILSGNRSQNHEIIATTKVNRKKTLIDFQEN